MVTLKRVAINSSISINVFASDMESEIEGTLIKFIDDTELLGVVTTLGGRDSVDSLERWICSTHPIARSCTWVGTLLSRNII